MNFAIGSCSASTGILNVLQALHVSVLGLQKDKYTKIIVYRKLEGGGGKQTAKKTCVNLPSK